MLKAKSKGQMGNLKELGLGIVILVVVLAVSALLLADIKDEVADETTVTNETLGTVSSVPTTLSADNDNLVSGSDSLYTWNTTSGAKIGDLTRGTNYTVISYRDGDFNITDVGGDQGSDLDVNATYDFLADNNATAITDDGLAGVEDLAGWIPIVVIAVVGVLVIGLIVVGFRKFGGETGF